MQDKTQTMLTEQDAALLEQGASMLEGLENDERNRGNCSTAEGAARSAHAVRRLAASLLAHERSISQCLHQIQEPSSAEQAAWHAGLDEGRAQAAPAAVAVPDERAAFEVGILKYTPHAILDCHDGQYVIPWVQAAWTGWQARAALAAIPAAAPTEGFELWWEDHMPSATQAEAWAAWVALHNDSAAAAPVVLPAGWVPCIVTHEGQHPEEVAYGPQVMMDRLKKWLERYFELIAATPVVLPEPEAVIKEVMELVKDWGMKEHFSGEAQLDAHSQEATPVDEDRAKRCWEEERAAWKAIETKMRALLTEVSAPTQISPEWEKVRRGLTMVMLGLAGRPDCSESAIEATLDAVTEPGMPLAGLRMLAGVSAPAAQAVAGELIEAVDAWFAKNTGLGGCSDKDVAELAAIFAAPHAQEDARDAAPAAQAIDIAELVTGMSVSVDVSTGEHDAFDRYFGTVTEVMEAYGDKHGLTLLIQDAKPNFTAPAASEQDAVRYRYLRDVPMCDWPGGLSLAIKLQQNAHWDRRIDAAIAAQAAQQGGGDGAQ